jgi:hypothetical protein
MLYGPEIEALKKKLFSKTVTYNMNMQEKKQFLEKMQKRYRCEIIEHNLDAQIEQILNENCATSAQREAMIREFRGQGPKDWDVFYQKVFFSSK